MKEGTTEKNGNSKQSWKRILLVAALISVPFVSVFAVSLVYYAATDVYSVFRPLRIDSVPSGAYVVPWMQPSPSIDTLRSFSSRWWNEPWDPEMVMASALKLNVTFSIAVGNATRVIPSTVYFGHDTDYLYVAGKFLGMYRNPYAGKDEGIAQYFAVFFDANNDGVLRFPESGSRFVAAFLESDRWHPSAAWGCDDMIWTRNPWNRSKHDIWLSAENYYNSRNSHLPQPATLHNAWGYDNATGTWIILFSRYLLGSGDAHTNAFIMRSGERWVMGFNLELGFTPGGAQTQMLTDGWPKKTYPYESNDASWWPKLMIDLANPPSWLYP